MVEGSACCNLQKAQSHEGAQSQFESTCNHAHTHSLVRKWFVHQWVCRKASNHLSRQERGKPLLHQGTNLVTGSGHPIWPAKVQYVCTCPLAANTSAAVKRQEVKRKWGCHAPRCSASQSTLTCARVLWLRLLQLREPAARSKGRNPAACEYKACKLVLESKPSGKVQAALSS